jgi:hypothetical protein
MAALVDSGSLRHRVPRPGFDYPLRDLHHQASQRVKRAGASMGFTLQGLPLIAIGTPLGARCHPVVTGCTPPSRREMGTTWPASWPSSRDESVLSPTSQGCGPSIPSWGSFLQSLLPFVLALTLIAARPLSPSGGLTSRPARAPGYCGANEWSDPSPDHQLSWSSLPFDNLGAPFIVHRGGRMILPHVVARLRVRQRSVPLRHDATADPGPATRHRCQSVYVR